MKILVCNNISSKLKHSTSEIGYYSYTNRWQQYKMTEKYEKYSPDRKYRIEFYDFNEPRMGMTICKFKLSDLSKETETEFSSLWAIGIGNGISWTDNSEIFSLPIANPNDNYFIFDIKNQKFTSIHFRNCWVLNGNLKNDRIEIEFRDDQIPEKKEHNKYPTKNFSKPENLTFKLSELTWIDITLLKDFDEMNKSQTLQDLQPIDNGWRKFKGDLPKDTEILVWELREFAKYGDSQSIEWFDLIKAKTKDINYWVNASNYLGFIKRNTAANKELR